MIGTRSSVARPRVTLRRRSHGERHWLKLNGAAIERELKLGNLVEVKT
jgi:hypothetical protein